MSASAPVREEPPPAPPEARAVRRSSTFGTLRRLFWTLSMREAPGFLRQTSRDKPRSRRSGWWLFGLYGLITALGAFMLGPAAYSAWTTMMVFMLVGTAVASDFATVIVAPGEDEILFHLPLRSSDYLAARLVVAAQHVLLLTLCLGALPVVADVVAHGSVLHALGLAVAVLLTAAFVLVTAFATYRIALRLLGGPRLREALAWAPTLAGFVTTLTPQILPRLLGNDRLEALPEALLWAMPPMWFGALPEALVGPPELGTALRACLGVVAVFGGGWLLIGALSRGLLGDMQRLMAEAEGTRSPTRPTAGRAPDSDRRPWRWLGLSDPDAAAGYLLARGAMRQREFRMRTLSGALLPFVFLLVAPHGRSATTMVGWCAAMFGLSFAFLPVQMQHHEHHAAAWLYAALPVRRPGRFLGGALLAGMLRSVTFGVPLMLFAAWWVTRDPWAPALALLALSGSAFAMPLSLGEDLKPPFSRPVVFGGEHGERLLQILAAMVPTALLTWAGSALVTRAPWALPLLTLAVLGLAYLMVRSSLRRMDGLTRWGRGQGG